MALPNPKIIAHLWHPGAGMPYSEEATQALIDGLTAANLAWLRHHKTPGIYSSGVKYKRERGRENWRAIPAVLAAGNGDCEDLAAWRAAELQNQGKQARAVLIKIRPKQYHVVVESGGKREDPSRLLMQRARR
jgi:hypothetical protein